MSFTITDKARAALTALRETDERRYRTKGIVQAGSFMCACAVMAKALDIPVSIDTTTTEIINRLVEETGIPGSVMETVPAMNDAVVPGRALGTVIGYRYSWSQIADQIERFANDELSPLVRV